MKKRLLALLLFPLILGGCNNTNSDTNFQSASITHERKTGGISAFNLTGPDNSFSTNEGFTFTWETANNADYYQLEIATTFTFISDDEDEVYVKESNLINSSFKLTYSLPKKDLTYYWRVTAINKDHTKESNQINSFYYESTKVGEIPIKIEDAQDWVLHKEGSYADISIDRSNFFNNGQNSLAIVFDKEHTNRGVPSSDGWMVITKTEDRELYGTDAFYFNFYYSGHDASVLIRVLDYDGEYWHQQVKIANNAKQTIIAKYEDFTLRTQTGSPINNRVFDWEHIRYFEIVFERTFGDGICLLSNIKAVQFDNYKHLYIQKEDFRSTPMSDWTYENYDFEKTISDDGSELTLHYTARNAETNPNGFNGYGFQSINVNKFLADGDALRMKVKYTGSGSGSIFYFRILEEDNDRWQFKVPFSYLIKDDYKELIVPLKAFQRTDYLNGDGAKQFYFIQKFNFGLADNYSTGTLSVKDLEVIKIDDIVSDRKRVVGNDGCVDDFNNYEIYTQMYYYWDQSVENKDEAIKLDTLHKVGNGNPYCAEFDYKADMEMAVYQLYLDSTANIGKNAFSLWLKDGAIKPSESAVAYLNPNDVTAELTIQLTMDSGEWYRYVIDKVSKEWNKYTIAFSDFELNNGADLFDAPNPLSSEHIIHIAFGFKYLYYDQQGNHHPLYCSANPCYVDEIYFVNASSSYVEEVSGTIKEDSDNPDRITIETMEDYTSTDDLFASWSYGSEKSYNSISISNDVSSQGGNQSIKMHYQGADSVSYVRNTVFANTVIAKGVCLDIKGDGKATVYLNLNWRSGTTLYKMRFTLENLSTSWTHYEIGFTNFKDVNGSNKSLSQNTAKEIESISFGIVNKDYSGSDIYVDNIRFLKNISYSANTSNVID